eukprot:5568813-Pleurochrysis_carterae.AAC.3
MCAGSTPVRASVFCMYSQNGSRPVIDGPGSCQSQYRAACTTCSSHMHACESLLAHADWAPCTRAHASGVRFIAREHTEVNF